MDPNDPLGPLEDRLYYSNRRRPFRVAVDGIDAAGKTTLADDLARRVQARNRPALRVSLDHWHNPRHLRYSRGELSPEGYYEDSFDYAAFTTLCLEPLLPANLAGDGSATVHTRLFDVATDRPALAAPVTVTPDTVVIVDGVFLLRPILVSHWDLKVFVDVPFDIALLRALHRDGASDDRRERYLQRYFPGQRIYLQQVRPQTIADVIVDNTTVTAPEVFLLT